MIMSTMLRMWLVVLLLVHYATSTFDVFGCMKGFFCPNHSKPKHVLDLIAGGYELIGFMPTYGDVAKGDKDSAIRQWSSILQDPLGSGAYLFENYSVAKKEIKNSLDPKVCLVFAPKDKLEKWSWVYVPLFAETYDTNNMQIQRYVIRYNRKNLQLYLNKLGYSDKDHSRVVMVTGDKALSGREVVYTMKIPKSSLDDTIFYCRGLSEVLNPEYLEILQTDLKWEEKFRSVWKLKNYPNPMVVPARH